MVVVSGQDWPGELSSKTQWATIILGCLSYEAAD